MKQARLKHIVFLRNAPHGVAWGGLEKLLMEWFERIDYSQYKVSLSMPHQWLEVFKKKFEAKNLPVDLVEWPGGLEKEHSLKRFIDLFRFLKTLRPFSVVFIQGWLFNFDFAHILAGWAATGGQVYMHENLGPPEMLPKTSRHHFGFIPGLGIWWHIKRFRASVRAHFAKKVIVVSHEIKKQLVAKWYYPAGRISVCHHGVDVRQFCPSPETRLKMRESMKVHPEETVILVAARLSKEKCIHRVIEAFDVVSQKLSGLTLMITGSGPLENDLKALARNKSCMAKIMFLGHVNDVANYFKMSDIYVLASDNEGFSIALLEAMASGLVCVATRCPGINEVIQDGSNGFLTEKSTEGILGGLRKALELSTEGRMGIRERAVRLASDNFEINERVRDVFRVLGLAYAANGEVTISQNEEHDRHAQYPMKILYIQPFCPISLPYGGRMRSRRFVDYLTKRAQVDFFCPMKMGKETDWDYVKAKFRRHYFAEHNGSLSRWKKILLLLPWQLSQLYSEDTQTRLNRLVEEERYDFIFVSKLYPVPYLLRLPSRWHTKVIIDFDDVLSDLYRCSYKDFFTSCKNSFFLKVNEEKALKHFRRVFLCADSALLKVNQRFHHKVGIIPNVFATNGRSLFEPPQQKNRLLFVGSLDYAPNVKGLLWFLRAVWPRIKEQYPGLKLTVIGKVQHSSERVYSQLSPYRDVRIEFNVPDVKPYYRESFASVVPLLNGSGTRLKILESYAYGRPVLTTPKGMEGLDFEDKKDIFVFQDTQAFQDGYRALLDQELYRKVCDNGFNVLEKKYSPSAFEKSMDENWRLITQD